MTSLALPKSLYLIPVQEEHLVLISKLRERHSAWHSMTEDQVRQAFQEKWSGPDHQVSRWLITIQNRVYGEIGWKSHTPGEYLYIDLIIYRKELYGLDLARHCITPFVQILTRHFRIHTVRCSILRPDSLLEKFLGSMNFRQIAVRSVPPRDFFPGGVMASYEVECDHLIHKFSRIRKIRWKSLQLIPFKLLDTDSAPVDFMEHIKTVPDQKKTVSLKNRKDLITYYQSLPELIDTKTVVIADEGRVLKIGTAILSERFPDSLIWHPKYQTIHIVHDLFACILDTLRSNPIIRSGYVHQAQKEKIKLLKTFNFIQDSHDSEGFSSWHLETVALPDRDLLLTLNNV